MPVKSEEQSSVEDDVVKDQLRFLFSEETRGLLVSEDNKEAVAIRP